MKKVVILVALLASCSSRVQQAQNGQSPAVQGRREFTLAIPKDGWEPIFFKPIDERARIANLPSLRSGALPQDDLETRVWIGFGLTALRGFDLKRSAGQWSGLYLQGIHAGLARNEYQKQLRTPKSGWDACWRRLEDAGILKLPDAAAIDCRGGALDGVSYVVETNMNASYRTYLYDNPQVAKCQEAKQMMEINRILYDEFGL